MPLGLTTIKPGQTHKHVPRMKRALVARMRAKNLDRMAKRIDVESTRYGGPTVDGIEWLQRQHGLRADGVVGAKTWMALGFQIVDIADLTGISLRGIPWVRGVRPMDGNWVNTTMYKKLLAAKRGGWSGNVYSGYRPDWYQAILFKRAVARYGSYSAASRWVAPPGHSAHRFKDPRGACDCTEGWQLASVAARLSLGLYRPMNHEPWHFQIRSAWRSLGVDRLFSGPDAEPSAEDVKEAEASANEVLDQIVAAVAAHQAAEEKGDE